MASPRVARNCSASCSIWPREQWLSSEGPPGAHGSGFGVYGASRAFTGDRRTSNGCKLESQLFIWSLWLRIRLAARRSVRASARAIRQRLAAQPKRSGGLVLSHTQGEHALSASKISGCRQLRRDASLRDTRLPIWCGLACISQRHSANLGARVKLPQPSMISGAGDRD